MAKAKHGSKKELNTSSKNTTKAELQPVLKTEISDSNNENASQNELEKSNKTDASKLLEEVSGGLNNLASKPKQNKTVRFKKQYLFFLFGFLLFCGLVATGLVVYSLNSDQQVEISTQKEFLGEEVKITVDGQERKIENGKLKLAKNDFNKNIIIEHPDYETLETNLKRTDIGLFFPEIKLKPVDYATIELVFSHPEKEITKNPELVKIDGLDSKDLVINEGEEKKVWTIKTDKINISDKKFQADIPDFTLVEKDLNLTYGRNKFTFDLEYNRRTNIQAVDILTGQPIAEVKIDKFESQTDGEGRANLQFLQNHESLTFSKDGYSQKIVKIGDSLPTKVALSPARKMAYPKKSANPGAFGSHDLYVANIDGTDEKLIQPQVVVGYQKGSKYYYAIDSTANRNQGTNYETQLIELDLNTLEKKVIREFSDTFLNGNFTSYEFSPKSAAVIKSEYDNGNMYPSYNKLTIDSVFNPAPVTVRSRNFPRGTSEEMRGVEVSKDGKLVSYVVYDYNANRRKPSSFGGTIVAHQSQLKVVDVVNNKAVLEMPIGVDVQAGPGEILTGNRFLIYYKSGAGNYDYKPYLLNIQTKQEKPINGEIFYAFNQKPHQFLIHRTEGPTQKILSYNGETGEEKLLLENPQIKNYFGNDDILYVRVGTVWNILDEKGGLNPVEIKPEFTYCEYYFGTFRNVARGCNEFTPEEEERLR